MGRSKKVVSKDVGVWHFEKFTVTKKDINLIKKKAWDQVSPIEIQKLYTKNWKTNDISSHFEVTPTQILNRLRS